MVRRAF